MKIQKGCYGYITNNKKFIAIKAAVGIGIILAIFIAGYIITKTNLNWFTFAAVLFAMPVGRIIVNFIMIVQHKSMPIEDYEKIKPLEDENIIILYDIVLTSYEKTMEIDSAAIKLNTLCAYSKSEQLDMNATTKHIKDILANSGCNASVKIYKDIDDYINRVKGMKNNLDLEDKSEKAIEREKQKEVKIKNVLCSISL